MKKINNRKLLEESITREFEHLSESDHVEITAKSVSHVNTLYSLRIEEDKVRKDNVNAKLKIAGDVAMGIGGAVISGVIGLMVLDHERTGSITTQLGRRLMSLIKFR